MSDHNTELASASRKKKNYSNLKRKSESQTELVPQKRMKLEDVLLKDINEKKDKNIKCKRRRKILTTLQLKKRFKYYCKKHDSSYLIKANRQKAKESVKERRFDLIQKFRSLNVTASKESSMEIESSYVMQNVEECPMVQDHNSSRDVNIYQKERPTMPEYIKKTRRLLKNSIDFDDEDDFHDEKNYNNIFDRKLNFSHKNNFETNFESDSDSDHEKENYRPHILKSFSIQKNQGNDEFTFEQNDDVDYIEIDCCEDARSDCDCNYLDELKHVTEDVTYYSSDYDY